MRRFIYLISDIVNLNEVDWTYGYRTNYFPIFYFAATILSQAMILAPTGIYHYNYFFSM
jgi:hypothetical protein